MPELPEVETVRRQLEPLVAGRRVSEVRIEDARLTRPVPPEEVAALLRGRRVRAVGRRGKYLVFELDRKLRWLAHLRMTGSFASGSVSSAKHRRAELVLDDGLTLSYTDVRRFGTWAVLEDVDCEKFLSARLGPEPLERSFDAGWLAECLAGSHATIKSALLDQRTVAGVGNIYADEALWRARIHPERPSATLSEGELEQLVDALRHAIGRGIERQGATLRDYRAPNGASGAMQEEFAVYGREGEPCEACAAPIAKTRLAGRGTWYLPRLSGCVT